MSFFSLFTDDEEDKERQAVLEYWNQQGSLTDKDSSSTNTSASRPFSPSTPDINKRAFTEEERKAARLIARVILRRVRFKRFVRGLRKDREEMLNKAAARIQALCRMVLGML